MRTSIRSTFFVPCLLAALAARAHATTIVVPPGPGTPVQDAIDAAAPGDTIRLMIGDYPEDVVITKPIKLRGVRSAATTVDQTTNLGDAGCGGGPTVTIIASGVQMRGILVFADPLGGIDVRGDRNKLTDLYVLPSHCGSVFRPLVNVTQSTRTKLFRVTAVASAVLAVPAGIRIADIVAHAAVRVSKSNTAHNVVGVLLENCADESVRVSACNVNYNVRGIVLQGTTGATVERNTLFSDSTTGVFLDAASTGNAILRNKITGSATDVSDAGSGNCWRNNVFTTGSVPPCP